jgi:hypothetical protein
MIRLVVTSISVMALIIGIGYLPGTYPVQTTTPVDLGAPLLLAAADEAGEASGEEEKKEETVPGIDRIASSVCYG